MVLPGSHPAPGQQPRGGRGRAARGSHGLRFLLWSPSLLSPPSKAKRPKDRGPGSGPRCPQSLPRDSSAPPPAFAPNTQEGPGTAQAHLEDHTAPGSPCALPQPSSPRPQGPHAAWTGSHTVRAVTTEFLSRQNQLNGTHSPNTETERERERERECVCVYTCACAHTARKERAGARALVHPEALLGLQPADAHSAPGSLGLDTRTRSCASGSLLGLPHGRTPSPRQQSLSPRETQSWAGQGHSTLSWELAPPSSCLCSSLSL